MPARVRLPSRRAGIALAAAGALVVAVGVRAPAHAGTIAGTRAEASSVAGRVTALSGQLAALDARERAANAHLATVRMQAAAARTQLRSARSQLAGERQLLARLLVAAYKSDAPSTTAFLLSSHSLSDLIARIEVEDRAGNASAAAVEQLRRTLAQTRSASIRLDRAQAAAASISAAVATERHTIASELSQEQSLYAGLQHQISRMVTATRAAQRQAAATRHPSRSRRTPAPAPTPPPVPPVGSSAIVAMIDHAFGAHAAVALAIAERESGLNPNARNPSGASGLFQLMPIWWQGKFDPFNPAANIAAAYAISRGGTDWSAWGGP
jgi:soluble lytic murein transglycosylase-like protein